MNYQNNKENIAIHSLLSALDFCKEYREDLVIVTFNEDAKEIKFNVLDIKDYSFDGEILLLNNYRALTFKHKLTVREETLWAGDLAKPVYQFSGMLQKDIFSDAFFNLYHAMDSDLSFLGAGNYQFGDYSLFTADSGDNKEGEEGFTEHKSADQKAAEHATFVHLLYQGLYDQENNKLYSLNAFNFAVDASILALGSNIEDLKAEEHRKALLSTRVTDYRYPLAFYPQEVYSAQALKFEGEDFLSSNHGKKTSSQQKAEEINSYYKEFYQQYVYTAPNDEDQIIAFDSFELDKEISFNVKEIVEIFSDQLSFANLFNGLHFTDLVNAQQDALEEDNHPYTEVRKNLPIINNLSGLVNKFVRKMHLASYESIYRHPYFNAFDDGLEANLPLMSSPLFNNVGHLNTQLSYLAQLANTKTSASQLSAEERKNSSAKFFYQDIEGSYHPSLLEAYEVNIRLGKDTLDFPRKNSKKLKYAENFIYDPYSLLYYVLLSQGLFENMDEIASTYFTLISTYEGIPLDRISQLSYLRSDSLYRDFAQDLGFTASLRKDSFASVKDYQGNENAWLTKYLAYPLPNQDKTSKFNPQFLAHFSNEIESFTSYKESREEEKENNNSPTLSESFRKRIATLPFLTDYSKFRFAHSYPCHLFSIEELYPCTVAFDRIAYEEIPSTLKPQNIFSLFKGVEFKMHLLTLGQVNFAVDNCYRELYPEAYGRMLFRTCSGRVNLFPKNLDSLEVLEYVTERVQSRNELLAQKDKKLLANRRSKDKFNAFIKATEKAKKDLVAKLLQSDSKVSSPNFKTIPKNKGRINPKVVEQLIYPDFTIGKFVQSYPGQFPDSFKRQDMTYKFCPLGKVHSIYYSGLNNFYEAANTLCHPTVVAKGDFFFGGQKSSADELDKAKIFNQCLKLSPFATSSYLDSLPEEEFLAAYNFEQNSDLAFLSADNLHFALGRLENLGLAEFFSRFFTKAQEEIFANQDLKLYVNGFLASEDSAPENVRLGNFPKVEVKSLSSAKYYQKLLSPLLEDYQRLNKVDFAIWMDQGTESLVSNNFPLPFIYAGALSTRNPCFNLNGYNATISNRGKAINIEIPYPAITDLSFEFNGPLFAVLQPGAGARMPSPNACFMNSNTYLLAFSGMKEAREKDVELYLDKVDNWYNEGRKFYYQYLALRREKEILQALNFRLTREDSSVAKTTDNADYKENVENVTNVENANNAENTTNAENTKSTKSTKSIKASEGKKAVKAEKTNKTKTNKTSTKGKGVKTPSSLTTKTIKGVKVTLQNGAIPIKIANKYNEDFKLFILNALLNNQSKTMLSESYGVAISTISRWEKELGGEKLQEPAVKKRLAVIKKLSPCLDDK